MKTDTACECEKALCDDGLNEWPRYFPRQLITPDDMTLEQDYFRNKLRRHNRLMHGWGVVCGAMVCPAVTADGDILPWKVIVKSGYILGPYGDEILIDRDCCFDLRTRCLTGASGEACGEQVDPWCSEVWEKPETSGRLYVAVRYKQLLTRPVRVQPVGCGCEETSCEYSRRRDGYEICTLDHCPDSHAQEPPDLDDLTKKVPRECPECPSEPWVVLACLEVDEKGCVEKIDNCACRRIVISFGSYWWKCKQDSVAVEAVEPPQLTVDVAEATLELKGTGFHRESEIILGEGIHFIPPVQVTESGLRVKVRVEKEARPGPRDIRVVNPDGSMAMLAHAITIAAAEEEKERRKRKSTGKGEFLKRPGKKK